MGIRQKFHNIKRIRQILHVMIKYGFGFVVEQLHVEQNFIGKKVLNIKSIKKAELADLSAPVRLRKAMEELGPTFIKLGQILSMRPDIIPYDFVQEFVKLQDNVPEFEYELAKSQIEQELGKSIREEFSFIQKKPRACASLAQVYDAKLKSGEDVVIKVQRPNIQNNIHSDIEILYELAYLAEKHFKELRYFNTVKFVDEFKRIIEKEIDFHNEASNIDMFRNSFKDDNRLYIPKVFKQYTSKKILIMERVEGIKITDQKRIEAASLDKKLIAKNGADILLEQIFIKGCFHADPHPGNILVSKDNRIIFFDFGIVGRLTENMKLELLDILLNLVRQDVRAVRETILLMGQTTATVNITRLDLDLEEFISKFYNKPLKEIDMGLLFTNLIKIVSTHKIYFPHDFSLLCKTLMNIDTIGKALDEDFNIIDKIKPFIVKLQRYRYSPERLTKELRRYLKVLLKFTSSLPKDLSIIVDKLKHGKLKVEFEHVGLEQFNDRIDRGSNRITFGVIIASLVIGSSIIMQSGIGPMLFGLPVFGLIGFITAGIMGLGLLITIIFTRKL